MSDLASKFKECPAPETLSKIGDTVTLRCTIKDKLVVCIWRRPSGGTSGNGETLRLTHYGSEYRRYIDNVTDTNSCHLQIMSVKAEDSGPWICMPIGEGEHSGVAEAFGRIIVPSKYHANSRFLF